MVTLDGIPERESDGSVDFLDVREWLARNPAPVTPARPPPYAGQGGHGGLREIALG